MLLLEQETVEVAADVVVVAVLFEVPVAEEEGDVLLEVEFEEEEEEGAAAAVASEIQEVYAALRALATVAAMIPSAACCTIPESASSGVVGAVVA